MKIIRGGALQFIPASHEDPQNPGVLKKVLLKKEDLLTGRIEMVNWAKLAVGRSFNPHYHQDMEEIFIILNGEVKIKIDGEEEILNGGDAAIIPMGKTHEMENISQEDVNYIALGVSLGKGGRTVNV